MKKKLFILFFAMSLGVYGQEWCATEKVQAEFEAKDPSVKQARLNAEAKLLAEGTQNYLKKWGIDYSSAGKTLTTVYEIPVVVHVIVPTGAAIGTSFNKTDSEIAAWIDNANRMFATTYGNGYYAEGVGNDWGTVIPIKLVLAKRNPQCQATTGIIRYDGGVLPNYDTYGVNRTTTNGVTTTQVKTIAPHWPESSYFNIYVINKIDGGDTYGITGWAGYPTNPDSSYDSFMKSFIVTLPNNNTLAHEFGHAMALIHPFDPADSNGGVCPANNDCMVDNDKVCDTPPVQSLIGASPTPSNSDTNPCTSQLYEGVQYNIMGYTFSPRKFTPGQRDRAIAQFLNSRSTLTQSLGATDLASNPGGGSLLPTSCVPVSLANPGNYQAGPTLVKIGNINNKSQGQNNADGNKFYIDYSTQNCLNKVFYTDLNVTDLQNIQVNIIGNTQSIRVWIDYNNNGVFETTELAASANNVPITGGFSTDTVWNGTFTASPVTVLNTPLRMRVIADLGSVSTTNACANLNFGQSEDYSVTFRGGTLNNSEVKTKNKLFSIYPNPTNDGNFFIKLNSSGKNAKVEITDASGRTVLKSDFKENKDDLKINSDLTSGVYFVKVQTGNSIQTEKLIVKK